MTIWRKNHDYLGIEYDWLVTDVDGYLGYFASAGFGPLPEQLLDLGDIVYEIIERTAELPTCGKAIVLRESGNIFEWMAMAERGFYAYDWDHMGESYQLIAKPTKPIRIELITDKQIVNLAKRVIVSFSIPNQEKVIAE